MASLCYLRAKQKSLSSTLKITSALKMLSGVHFNQSQQHLRRNQIFLKHLQDVVARWLVHRFDFQARHFWLEPPSNAPYYLVIVTSDRGLCGSFNSNISKFARRLLAEKPEDTKLVFVGKKGKDALRSYACDNIFPGASTPKSVFITAQNLQSYLWSLIIGGRASAIDLLSTQFISTNTCVPRIERLCPLFCKPHPDGEVIRLSQQTALFSYETSPEKAFEKAQEILFRAMLYLWLQESAVSEHASRMIAMDSAYKNAKDMASQLKLKYNRLRQSTITSELIEIIAGAGAL